MKTVIRSFKNSCNGIRLAWAEDQSFRNTTMQVVFGCVLATGFVLYYNETAFIWLLLVSSLLPILIIETVNSSIEAVTDKASPERHPLAKKAKDIGSAAVLFTRILAIICWATVLVNHFE